MGLKTAFERSILYPLKPIERSWKPYLEGRSTFTEAIDSLVATLKPVEH